MSFDLSFFKVVHSIAGDFEFLDNTAIFLGKYLPYFLVLVVLFFCLRRKTWREKIYCLIFNILTVILARGLVTEAIRFFYDRPRPFEALDFKPLFFDYHPSFPSGHAATFFSLAFVVFVFNKRLGFWLFFFATLNSFARVFAGVHWPGDLLGGFLVAFLSYLTVSEFLARFKPAPKEVSLKETAAPETVY